MNLHVLAGLPRSGSTLLGNVLAQHPDVHVSGTSALPLCIEAVVNVLSNSPEVQSDLAKVPGAYERYVAAMRGLVDGWYAAQPEAHVVDKGRGWILQRALLDQLSPGGAMIVCVRDPRDVLASIERQNRRTAAFNSPVARTIYEACELLMVKEGMVGGPMRFVEDLIRRGSKGVVFVPYESFVSNPTLWLDRIHKTMGVEPFEHDLDNVVNVATDLDALYRNKYPHDGSGAIKPTGHDWRDTLDADLAVKVAGLFPLYMSTFGYE